MVTSQHPAWGLGQTRKLQLGWKYPSKIMATQSLISKSGWYWYWWYYCSWHIFIYISIAHLTYVYLIYIYIHLFFRFRFIIMWKKSSSKHLVESVPVSLVLLLHRSTLKAMNTHWPRPTIDPSLHPALPHVKNIETPVRPPKKKTHTHTLWQSWSFLYTPEIFNLWKNMKKSSSKPSFRG